MPNLIQIQMKFYIFTINFFFPGKTKELPYLSLLFSQKEIFLYEIILALCYFGLTTSNIIPIYLTNNK